MHSKVADQDVQWAQWKESERLNHGPPKPRQNRDALEEKLTWEMWSVQIDSKGQRATAGVSYSSNESHCCKTQFDELKPIMLKEMKVPMIHTGRYLVCKCLCKPLPIINIMETPVEKRSFSTCGISMLIQDLNGDVEEVNAFNYLYEFANVEWMTSETIMIIKEPWLLYTSQGKTPSFKVDSPSDIIFVDSADEKSLDKIGAKKWFVEKSKDAEVWRQKANECFKNGNFEKALFFYDRAIRCNPELSVLYLNKSLTMGQAAYGMREWQKAAELFLSVLKEFPQNALASEQLKRATSRKKEKPELDVADYIGPIEIVDIPGKNVVKLFLQKILENEL
uniref:Uncharacterized protein n=1 Tax=Panagrolaimus sp. PS1159 TaxID=55785 RepID=A0AC35GTY5_9BILA